LSRREFLKSSGIVVLAGAASPLLWAVPPFHQTDALHGRALSVLDVYDSPSPNANVTNRLFPDSVVHIVDTLRDWYRLTNGYAKRSDIQPMMLTHQTIPTPVLPFWAEVSGSVAVVRRWCAADAPLVARIGHGGVARVVDRLPGDNYDWYAVADEENLLGWSSASVWTPIEETRFEEANAKLHIDTTTRQVEFLEDDRLVLRAPVVLGTTMIPGIYPIDQRKPSVMFSLDIASDGYGVPWAINFGRYFLAGAYWHNEFGTNKSMPGPDVQVAPSVSRWLYERLPEGSLIVVS
jgi:hypothetical protein